MSRLLREAEAFPEFVRGAIRKAALDIDREAKDAAPRKTGALRRSIMSRQETPDRWRVGVDEGPTLAYARIRDRKGGISKPPGYLSKTFADRVRDLRRELDEKAKAIR